MDKEKFREVFLRFIFVRPMESTFTLDDVMEELEKNGIEVERKLIKKRLERMNKSGILVDHTVGYALYRRYF